MPRKRNYSRPPQRLQDPRYNSLLVSWFVNCMMRRGKKSLAESIVYTAFDIVQKKLNKDPLSIFKTAVENVRPRLAVKPRRVGGATYQVPAEVPEKKGIFLAFRWIITNAKARKGKPITERLASELIDAANNTGASVKKKQDTHRMAEGNKAFAHYRW
ncbi:TPA: 30S ribosomal protein S7 [bacterium]|nr:30S ribosomal protein S7 [bacterium]